MVYIEFEKSVGFFQSVEIGFLMVRTVRTLLNHLLLGTLFRDLNSKSKNTILAGFFSTLNLSEEGRCFKDLKISALVCWFLSLKFGKMSKMAFF